MVIFQTFILNFRQLSLYFPESIIIKNPKLYWPKKKHCPTNRRLFTSTSMSPSLNFITTPIYYVNGPPHIGHLYTSLIADAYRRYLSLKRDDNAKTIFSTGTDEHGMKIEKAAVASGLATIQHCDKISTSFQKMGKDFSIEPTDFVRTTEPRHFRAVEHFWATLQKNGHIYKSEYQGWYSVPDEAFIPESNLVESPQGKVSGESGHPVEWTSEENYIFKLSNFIPEVKRWVKTPGSIRPSKFRDILLQTIDMDEGLQDLSVSRPKSRLNWGISVPGDESQVIYVWLDALVNYLTVAGYPDKLRVWPPSLQVVGKDILKFHGIYWPAFLMAAGLEPPKSLLVHSHWTVDGRKMSKSVGNVVDPFPLGQIYGEDGLRYFLLREGTPHSDANFTEEKMRRILNAELADTFGNLLSRCSGKAINPLQRWPAWDPVSFPEALGEHGVALKESLEALPDKVESSYNEFNFYRGLEQIMITIRLANLYVQETKPWELAKTSPQDPVLLSMLSLVFETLRITSIMTWPIIPNLSTTMLDRINVDPLERNWSSLKTFIWELDLKNASEKQEQISHKSLGPAQNVFYKRVRL